MDNKKVKKNKILRIAGLVGLFLLVFGISFALFTITLNGTKKNRIATGRLSLRITDRQGHDETEGYAIDLVNAIPTSDEDGIKQNDKYEFNVENDGTIPAKYDLYVKVLSSTLDASKVKFFLEEDGQRVTANPELITAGNTATDDGYIIYRIDNDLVNVDENHEYTLRIWLDEAADNSAMNKSFEAQLYLSGRQLTKDENPFKENTLAYEIYEDYNVEDVTFDKEFNAYVNGTPTDIESSKLYRYPTEDGKYGYYFRYSIAIINVDEISDAYDRMYMGLHIEPDGSVRALRYGAPFKSYEYNNEDTGVDALKFNNSIVKQKLDEWYETSADEFDKYMVESTYCNDFRENSNSGFSQFAINAGLTTAFGVMTRSNSTMEQESDMVNYKVKPNLNCRAADRVVTKAALPTIDELILVGNAKIGYNNSTTWTMSPAVIGGTENLMYATNMESGIELLSATSESTIPQPAITFNRNAKVKSKQSAPANKANPEDPDLYIFQYNI